MSWRCRQSCGHGCASKCARARGRRPSRRSWRRPAGRCVLAFAKRYCAAEKGDFGWKTGGASNIDELTVQLHGVMLRRSKDDVLALPPKLRTWLRVEVPARTGSQAIKKVFALLA